MVSIVLGDERRLAICDAGYKQPTALFTVRVELVDDGGYKEKRRSNTI